MDDCEGIQCQHGGNCIDGVGTFNCNCLEGFSGKFCENGVYIITF